MHNRRRFQPSLPLSILESKLLLSGPTDSLSFDPLLVPPTQAEWSMTVIKAISAPLPTNPDAVFPSSTVVLGMVTEPPLLAGGPKPIDTTLDPIGLPSPGPVNDPELISPMDPIMLGPDEDLQPNPVVTLIGSVANQITVSYYQYASSGLYLYLGGTTTPVLKP